jgi:hypothetical protein
LSENLTLIERTFQYKNIPPQKETAIIMGLMAGFSAAFTALFIGYIAHDDFGFSRDESACRQ